MHSFVVFGDLKKRDIRLNFVSLQKAYTCFTTHAQNYGTYKNLTKIWKKDQNSEGRGQQKIDFIPLDVCNHIPNKKAPAYVGFNLS